MSALGKKLRRDLVALQGQVITIALVVACGIASYVTMQSAFDSLLSSRDAYYGRYRFADVFSHLEQAPDAVALQLLDIPGVQDVQTRVVEQVMVPVEGMPRPASGTLVSLPADSVAKLNAVHLTRGRLLDPTRSDEVLLLEAFAEAHALTPGDRVSAVINGTLRELRIAGLVMSPEYVMAIPPGGMAYDPKQIAVLWMVEDAARAAFRMEGAFNDVSLRLAPNASPDDVIDRVDAVLEPYGGMGAVLRDKQPSNKILDGELTQLEQMATVVPVIFLFVAAFLLSVVLSRLIHLQRPDIATLKAVGYTDREVGLHYLALVSVVMLMGAVLGLAGGVWLGQAMTDMYTGRWFRFPDARYRLELDVVVVSVGISLMAALSGALSSVRKVTALPPAEAMRPPAPARYRRTLSERLGLFKLLGPSARMVLREVERRPLRLLMSSFGISMAVGIVVLGGFWYDSIDYLIDVQFERAMREDVTVVFVKPLPDSEARGLSNLPGVWLVEGQRVVNVRFKNAQHQRDGALMGHPSSPELRRVVDLDGNVVPVPTQGLLLGQTLADILQVGLGDQVLVQLREGDRRTHAVRVTGVVDEAFGLSAHMNMAALHELLNEEPRVNTALLRIDPSARDAVYQRLKQMPWVAAVGHPGGFREHFEEQSAAIMRAYTFVLVLFASIIAIGVVYNNARVALSQRSRELASLRVLGFTRREIAAILYGELSIQVILAIPLGLWVGAQMVKAMISTIDPETFRLPVVLSAETFAFAAALTLAAAFVSALMVRRKLNRLDLVGVLKTRE